MMKLKRMLYSMMVLASMALASQAAFADSTVVYKINTLNGSGLQTIHYADRQHVRLDMNGAGNQKMSMLKLGDKVYSINGKMVQDLSQLAKMMTSMGMGSKSAHKTLPPIKFETTGKTETIAGVRGKVYHFVEKGKRHEVVLGQNKDLHDAALGVEEISKAAIGMMPFAPSNHIQQDVSMKNMVLLRLDDRMRLQSINTRAVPVATFTLPSKPQQMGGMGGLMKGALGK